MVALTIIVMIIFMYKSDTSGDVLRYKHEEQKLQQIENIKKEALNSNRPINEVSCILGLFNKEPLLLERYCSRDTPQPQGDLSDDEG